MSTVPIRRAVFAALTLVALPALAQPEPADRAAVLDALRGHVRREMPSFRGPLRFEVLELGVADGWAFVYANPAGAGPEPFLAAACGPGDAFGDPNVAALLRRSGRSWRVVDWGTCATDVFWTDWPERFGAPRRIFAAVPAEPARAAFVSTGGDGFLSLRSEPSASRGRRLARIPDGTRLVPDECRAEAVTVDRVAGRWCRVRHAGQDGWAFNGFLVYSRE